MSQTTCTTRLDLPMTPELLPLYLILTVGGAASVGICIFLKYMEKPLPTQQIPSLETRVSTHPDSTKNIAQVVRRILPNTTNAINTHYTPKEIEIIQKIGLDTWDTKGNKTEAIKRIVECITLKKAFLSLSRLELTSLPPNLFIHLPWLEELDLSYNILNTVENLSSLTKLEKLYLFNNNLRSIEGISYLTELQQLDISDNKLTSIEDLSPLTNLVTLNLSDNQLTSIEGLSSLTSLRGLAIDNNRFQREPHIPNLIKQTEAQYNSLLDPESYW